MVKSYQKSKGRNFKKQPFSMIPHKIMEHPNFSKLTSHSVRLLLDFIYQHRGKNYGDLTAAFSILKHRGWRSPGTLSKSIQELKYFGLIQVTRQGGRNQTTLFALTWLSIDDCGGKLDIATSRVPSNLWQVEREKSTNINKSKVNSTSHNMNQCSRSMNQLCVVGVKK